MPLKRRLWGIVPRLWLLDRLDQGKQLRVKEALHESRAVLDELVEELVGSLSALVVWGGDMFLVGAGADLLNDTNHVTLCVTLLLRLVVRNKEEFTEDLTDQVFLLDDAITDSLVGLGNDLASQSDQTDKKALLLSSVLKGFHLVDVLARGCLILNMLLLLDLVNDLIEEVIGVVDGCGGLISCVAIKGILAGLSVDQEVEKFEELHAWLVRDICESLRQQLKQEVQDVMIASVEGVCECLERHLKVDPDFLLVAEDTVEHQVLGSLDLAVSLLECSKFGV